MEHGNDPADDPRYRVDWEKSRSERLKSGGRALAINLVGIGFFTGLAFLAGADTIPWQLIVAVMAVVFVWSCGSDLLEGLPRTGVAMSPEGFRYSFRGERVETTWANVAEIREGTTGELGLPAIVVVPTDETQVRTSGWLSESDGSPVTIPLSHVDDLAGLAVAMRYRAGLPDPPARPELTVADLSLRALNATDFVPPKFAVVRWREGYSVDDVDAFVIELQRRIATDPTVATPDWVEDQRFTPVRGRAGYDMGSVDTWLDGVTAKLRG